MVTMKFSPVRIELNPMMNTPSSTGVMLVVVVVLYGV
jgi:hypothetical protein